MTRINVVPVEELTNRHLVAEYREIMRLPGNLRKALTRKGRPFSSDEIPSQYVLGKGHVKFFFNKFGYLKKRFEDLVNEMNKRGFKTSFTDSTIFDLEGYLGDYIPNEEAYRINRERIKERLNGTNNKEV